MYKLVSNNLSSEVQKGAGAGHEIVLHGDPTQEFSLSAFLERLTFKNPKRTKKSTNKSSVPINELLKSQDIDELAVNSELAPPDKVFFYKFFGTRAKNRESGKSRDRSRSKGKDAEYDSDAVDEFADQLARNLMQDNDVDLDDDNEPNEGLSSDNEGFEEEGGVSDEDSEDVNPKDDMSMFAEKDDSDVGSVVDEVDASPYQLMAYGDDDDEPLQMMGEESKFEEEPVVSQGEDGKSKRRKFTTDASWRKRSKPNKKY